MSEEPQGTPAIDIIGDGGEVADAIVPNPSTDTSGTWTQGMSDEQVGAIQNKGWESASDMYNSYNELEAWRGVPAEQLMKKPGEGESWDDFYSQIGRPEEASQYVYNAPEGVDMENNAMLDGIRETAFSEGMSAKQFTAMTDKYDEVFNAQQTASEEATRVAHDTEIETLKRELGDDFDKVVYNADQTAIKMGFSQKVVDAIRNSEGVKGMLDIMSKISDTIGEDTVDSANTARSPYGQTNEQLIADKANLMSSLKADPVRMGNYLKGIGPDYIEYQKLHNSIDYSKQE